MKHNLVRTAVRTALAVGAASTLTYSPIALGQEEGEEAKELDRVTVTGSRIKRIDIETARPVIVIDREDIESSGQPTVADVLRNSTVNTFGSFRENSGNSFAGQALVDLRGLGSVRTLVLLDGRRLPRSPVTGNQAIDLNTLPLEAVERIEILQDSASAIYGSDAIGGVINVILRKDYEGAQLMAGGSRPEQDGGDENNGSFLVGGASAKGSFIFSAELYNKDIIFSRDRPFTAVDLGDGVNFGTTEGVSLAGNTALDLSTFDLIPLANCNNIVDAQGQQVYAGIFNDPTFTPISQACTFGYADVSAETQQLKRQSAFLNADYEITPDITLTYQGSYSRLEAFGRYAPAVAVNEFALGPDLGAPLPASAPAEFQSLDAFLLLHRFAALGPRNDTNTNYLFYNALTVDGTTGNIGWELSAYHTQYDGKEIGQNYINREVAINLTSAGEYQPWDPFSPQSQAALDIMAATLTRDIEADFTGVSGLVSFDLFELPEGPVSWAIGFDYFDEHFFDIYDATREAGNAIGSAGNSAQGARVNYAGFFETEFTLFQNFDVNIAGRFDHYNDVGDEFSPTVALRYQPTDWILLRGSWGEGFRAPNMTNLFSAIAFSAEPVVDVPRCRELGIPDNACPDTQANTFSGGNPDLEPELSESINVGAVFDFDELQFSFDVWNVDIEDGLAIFTAQGLVDLQAEGLALPPGTSITRGQVPGGGIGPILRIDTGWANLTTQDVTGADISFDYNLETDVAGSFAFGLRSTYIFEFDEQPTPLDPVEDIAGTDGQPEFRANATVQWNYGDHQVTWITRHIDEYTNSLGDRIPSWTVNDIQYAYQLPWDGEVSLGVQNIGDNDPPLDPANDTSQPFDSDLYDFDGRVPYFFYRQRF